MMMTPLGFSSRSLVPHADFTPQASGVDADHEAQEADRVEANQVSYLQCPVSIIISRFVKCTALTIPTD